MIRDSRSSRQVVYAAILAMLFGSIALPVNAQVDRDELRKGSGPITFLNYEGPYAKIETVAQIRNIGHSPGLLIKAGSDRTGAQGRYFVIHSVSDPEGDRLDADIFGLGIDVGVDHIKNLRLIIQGYLEGAYDYSPRDAALLAEYITIYNAVFRGNWGYFSGRYKSPVLRPLTPERAGLSIRFDEWPGRTLILIPLALGSAGSLSAIDTTSLTETRVIDEMRTQDNMGLDQRKEMVDLKEREAEQAEERAAVQREAVAQEEKVVVQQRQQVTQERQQVAQERQQVVQERQQAAQERQQVTQERQQVTQERQQVAKERQQVTQERQQVTQERQQAQANEAAGKATPEETRIIEAELARREDAANRKDAELDQRDRGLSWREASLAQREEAVTRQEESIGRQEEAIARREETIDKREETIAKQEESLAAKREGVRQSEEFAERKTTEAQQERRDIVQDQQRRIAQEDQEPAPSGILAVSINNADSPLGRIVRLNPSSGAELRSSAMNTVNTRTLTQTGGKLIAVAGENRGNGAVRLVEINNSTLEMVKQGNDDIHPQSLLWVNGSSIYAIMSAAGNLYLARFNTNLVKEAQSSITVHPYASPSFQGDTILIQRTNGTPAILNATNLSERKQ